MSEDGEPLSLIFDFATIAIPTTENQIASTMTK